MLIASLIKSWVAFLESKPDDKDIQVLRKRGVSLGFWGRPTREQEGQGSSLRHPPMSGGGSRLRLRGSFRFNGQRVEGFREYDILSKHGEPLQIAL